MNEKEKSKSENKHYCSYSKEKGVEAEFFCSNCENYFDKDCYEKNMRK